MTANERKPTITWLEGLLDHYEAPFPHDPGDPRTMGFNVGRQIVGLYIIEMLLKYALDDAGTSHGKRHNLYQLFKNLHRQRRRAVERKYTQLLNNEFDSAWDVARTADSLLQYLGENPITDTRYFWEPGREHLVGHASILVAPQMLRPLIYALFVVLHNYPSQTITKRYNTTFQSLARSLENDQRQLQGDPKTHDSG